MSDNKEDILEDEILNDEEQIELENAENINDESNSEEGNEETLKSKIKKLELELEEWKSSYTRKLAEFQNFSRRKENEFAEMKKYAAEEIILRVLDNIDNLERAIDSSVESKNFDSLVEGVEMILKNMKLLLTDEGVEEIEAEGKQFDPYEHQPMMTETQEDVEDNGILQVFQKGYKMKGKVIRPAMVKINKK